ncbi:uncharacterized protein LOC141683101 [Apium graveolens]|uniref:uncharacterized protein LOC141683101 n=1 Tax=Apium graveolens TaxID=4045 RepID=UPI003D7B8E26
MVPGQIVQQVRGIGRPLELISRCSQPVAPEDLLFLQETTLVRFDQVYFHCLTMAVNFWWRSEVVLGMSEHMDAYYMRRIVKSEGEEETTKSTRLREMKRSKCICSPFTNPNKNNESFKLNLEKILKQSLGKIVEVGANG